MAVKDLMAEVGLGCQAQRHASQVSAELSDDAGGRRAGMATHFSNSPLNQETEGSRGADLVHISVQHSRPRGVRLRALSGGVSVGLERPLPALGLEAGVSEEDSSSSFSPSWSAGETLVLSGRKSGMPSTTRTPPELTRKDRPWR